MSKSPTRLTIPQPTDPMSPKSPTSPTSARSDVSRASSRKSSRPSSSRANDLTVTMKRIDGQEKMSFKIKCNKRISVGQVKERVSEEWGLSPHEQVILFRGQRTGADDRAMPLNTPDLTEVVKEAGENGLSMAVMYMPRKLPRFLEREGLETVNSKRSTMATGLHRAARRSELTVMEEILEVVDFEEADAVDNAGQTALHAAVMTWNRPACEILLKSKRFSNTTAADHEGRTVLHIAASWGDAKVVPAILDHWRFKRNDVILKDSFGLTALEYARDCGHEKAAELILKAVEARPRTPVTPSSRASLAARPASAATAAGASG